MSVIFSFAAFVLFFLGLADLKGEAGESLSLDYILSGIICLALSFIFAFQHKRQLQYRLRPRFLSVVTIKCTNESCNFKEEREFRRGDYIFKEVGSCPKCNSPLVVVAVYAKTFKKRFI